DISQVTINKMRPKPNVEGKMELIGDVNGKDVIIIDDMIDTSGTLCKSVDYLKKCGASSVSAVITHGVLSGNAYEYINNSDIDELIISDYINIPKLDTINKKLTIVSMANDISHIIYSMITNSTISHHEYEKF